jgi:hypothetical protein
LDTEGQITAEARLVLACLRCFVGTGDAGAVRELAREIHDWEAALDLARAHWVEPLVAWYLKANCADLMDSVTIANLDRVLRYCTASHLMLCVTLRNVLDVLTQHNIGVVPVKGPVLAAMLCDEIPWRDSCDLDLLVRREDISRAKDVLLAVGYNLDSDLPEGEERVLFHWRSQLVLKRDGPGPALDLHWQLLPSLYPAARHFESVWHRLKSVAFENRNILRLSDEDQLFFLCAHGARHSWHSLRLAADVARLIRVRPDLDWDAVIRAAREPDGGMVLALGLWITSRVLELKLPEPVERCINHAVSGREFAHRLVQRLRTAAQDEDASISEFGLQIKLAGGWWSKARCIAAYALLPSDSDGTELHLPPPLYFLYYLYRPARLTVKHAGSSFKSLFSRRLSQPHITAGVGRGTSSPSSNQ